MPSKAHLGRAPHGKESLSPLSDNNVRRSWVLPALLIMTVASIFRAFLAIGFIDGTFKVSPYLLIPLFGDFNYIYVHQLASLAAGLLPYRDFAYSAPPLFLYSLYPFFLVGGSAVATLPILAADTLTAPLTYLTAREFTSEWNSILAGLAYALLPLALTAEGITWLDSQPVTFFLLLSLYLAIDNRTTLSALSMGVAVLFHQEAAFAIPAYVVWNAVKSKTMLLKSILIPLGIFTVGSLPFLVLAPGAYLGAVTFGLWGVIFASSHSLPSAASIALPGNFHSFTSALWPLQFFQTAMSQYLQIPLILVALYGIYSIRHDSRILLLSSALSTIVFLLVFSSLALPVHAYYFLPVYAMLLAATSTRYGLWLVFLFSITSLAPVEGSYQIVIASFALLSAMVFRPKKL
jgi:4-amino-4-deoxy-L-arabinose transferase-like glycosyltransferase